jgi:Domain of unknown function (DUF4160)
MRDADHCLFLWDRHSDVLRRPSPRISSRLIAVSIATGEVIEGHLPANAAHLVRQWTLAHRNELEDNWRRARAGQPLRKIAGLDDD